MTTSRSVGSAASAPDGDEAFRERLRAAHEEAAGFFASRLRSQAGAGPRDYLARRGFDDVIDSALWEVGYAPPRWTELTEHLRRKGFSDSEISASGLGLSTRRSTVVDRFRDRITFGVRDEHGRVIAFIGRAAPRSGGVPRYLNSPRSLLYDKSAVLFGLGDQRSQLSCNGVPVIVEGPLDAVAVSIAGATGGPRLLGVAPCGTALSTAQVDALARVAAGPVLVAFDADPAGRAAAARSCATLVPSISAEVPAVQLPPGADPASILEERGPAGLRGVLAETAPLVDLVVDEVLTGYAHHLDNAEARLCALREVAPTVASLSHKDVARQAARLGSLLDLDHQTVARELAEAASPARFRPQPGNGRRHPQVAPSAGQLRRLTGELKVTRAAG